MVRCAHCLSINRTLMCSGCYCAFYCDADCERAHWNIHKKWCKVLGERMSATLNTYIQSQYVGMKRSAGSSIPSGGNPPPEKRKLTERELEIARAAEAAVTTATADAASAAASATTASLETTPEAAAAGNVLQGLPKELSEIYRPGVLFSITNADRILSLMHKTQVETKGSIQGTPAAEMIHKLLGGKETPFMVLDENIASLWMVKDGSSIERGDTPAVTLPSETYNYGFKFPFTNVCLFNYEIEGGQLSYNMLSGKTKTERFPGNIKTSCIAGGIAFIGQGSDHTVTMLYPSAKKDALISNIWKPATGIKPVVMKGCSSFVAFTEKKTDKKWFLNKLDRSGIPEKTTGREVVLPGISYFVSMEAADQQNPYMFVSMKKDDYYRGLVGLSTRMKHKLSVTTETTQYSFHANMKIYVRALEAGILLCPTKERIDVSQEADMHRKLKKNTRLSILAAVIPSKKYVEDAAKDAEDPDSEDYKQINWINTEFIVDYGLRDEIEIDYVFWDTIAVHAEDTGILWITRTVSSIPDGKLSIVTSDVPGYIIKKIIGISRKDRIAAVSVYSSASSQRKWYIIFDTLSGREITRTRDLKEIHPIMFYAAS